MPGMNGFEFLRWIKSEPELKAIPVIIFTEAVSPEDKAQALAQGAAGYFVKPVDFQQLVEMAESLRRFGASETN
jgi:CheY-like chemotaxis protein